MHKGRDETYLRNLARFDERLDDRLELGVVVVREDVRVRKPLHALDRRDVLHCLAVWDRCALFPLCQVGQDTAQAHVQSVDGGPERLGLSRVLFPPLEDLAHERGCVRASIDVRKHEPCLRWQLEGFDTVVPRLV